METETKFTVLIADDNVYNLRVLAQVVEAGGYESVLTLNGRQLFEFIASEKPDLILLDVIMPGLDGYEICKLLKQNEEYKDIPVIFVTGRAKTADIVKGFEAGGIDFITKPFNACELSARLRNHLELKKSRDEIKQYNEQLKQANRELREANRIILQQNAQLKEMMGRLDVASKTDPLTNLFNRRFMMEKIQSEVKRFNRSRRSFSIIIGDVDYFKHINDTFGHGTGDNVLTLVSQRLLATVRDLDVVCRWGGEEFLLLLPETGLDEAAVLAERIRTRMVEQTFKHNEEPIPVTITLGVAEYNGQGTIDDVIKQADNALYEGKRRGRNCVVKAAGNS